MTGRLYGIGVGPGDPELMTLKAVRILRDPVRAPVYIVGCLVLGFLLAVFIDQRVRAEGTFRTIYLYPHAMSFIVTGLVWQWFLNPGLGL